MKSLNCILGVSIFLLAACDDNNSRHQAELTVDELGAGRYSVSVGSEDAPSIGKYYADSGNNGFILLEGDDGKASQIYRRTESGSWSALPDITADTRVRFINSVPILGQGSALTSLPLSYVMKTPSGKVAKFTLGSNGHLTAGETDCQVSGDVSEGDLGNVFTVSLMTQNCDLSESSNGVLLIDNDYQPAVFRMILDADNAVLDLWAYEE
ncbi:MAG: hypothetical protein KBT72_09920 [Zhongshania sp.]|nr:hypothetical protein [Zhongshania sp.]